MHNYVWAIFFTFFQTCFFLKQCENYLYNYFLCFHITIIISITLKSNFTKKEGYMTYMDKYFMYNYTCLWIFICVSKIFYLWKNIYMCVFKLIQEVHTYIRLT